MSRVFEKGNSELNALVFETLSVRENDHVLEIGSGTGTLIKEIADHLTKGFIEGIDFSKPMVEIARKKNRKHIKTGKVKIHAGDFDQMQFDDDCFDKIFSVNTIYFWKNPQQTISRIGRMLKPGGRLVVGFHAKNDMEKMPLNRDVFQYYSTDDLALLLANNGPLNDVEIVSKQGRQKACHCAIGTK